MAGTIPFTLFLQYSFLYNIYLFVIYKNIENKIVNLIQPLSFGNCLLVVVVVVVGEVLCLLNAFPSI